MSDVHERIAALEAQLAELKAMVADDGAAEAGGEVVELTSDRRTMLRRLALGAAGAAAAGVAWQQTAAAADGNFIQIGTEAGQNSGTNLTRTIFTGANTTGTTFVFEDGNRWTANQSKYPSVVGGWASDLGKARSGVYGYTQWDDHAGVVGYGSLSDAGTIGGLFEGSRADLHLKSNGAVGAVAGVAHKAGDVVRTDDGDLWYVAADGTPGALRRLAGASTVGSLALAAPPKRVFDSRSGARLAANSTTVVDLKMADLSGVPRGANAALLTITATQVTANGFLTAYSNALATTPDTSTLNFTANQDIATTTVVACDGDAKIKITVGPNTSLHVIVDHVGYFL